MTSTYHHAAAPPTCRRRLEVVGTEGEREQRQLVVDEMADLIDGCRDRVAVRIDLGLRLSGELNAFINKPMPFSPARRHVSGCVDATHSGGWGRCNGFGNTVILSSHR
jgi:hypothetical protein